jgi:hypothetical protein
MAGSDNGNYGRDVRNQAVTSSKGVWAVVGERVVWFSDVVLRRDDCA